MLCGEMNSGEEYNALHVFGGHVVDHIRVQILLV